ncbi:MAG: hypothetical protein J6L86_02770 [Alphaproteobacteria bacterium]|nr:hypothetical protein [Alphaproteobacteria bacterium]
MKQEKWRTDRGKNDRMKGWEKAARRERRVIKICGKKKTEEKKQKARRGTKTAGMK